MVVGGQVEADGKVLLEKSFPPAAAGSIARRNTRFSIHFSMQKKDLFHARDEKMLFFIYRKNS